ncbi:MAG: hypothetical protein H6555_08150 [Lewinellaceae bacterium]|nr:hypothetical protein [Lewinellaceae bacterium]
MGSVTNLTTTGDSDPEIFPETYYRHYMYCDRCGSFDIKPWIEPENHVQLAKQQRRAENGMTAAFVSLVLAGAVVLFSILSTLFLAGAFILPEYEITWLVLSAILYYIFRSRAAVVEAKIQRLGVRCGSCQATYKNGSTFFTDLTLNPKNYAMEDVPLPLNATFWIRGETVEK